MYGKFVAEYAVAVTPACSTCMHRSKTVPGICLAFPNGIPFEILSGKNDHSTLVKGDHGIRYEAAMPNLDDRCGKHFTYRSFIECGETQAKTGLPNLPKEADSYKALHELATNVLDLVVDKFGPIELTYGFSSPELIKAIPERIAPKLDQHASHEKNRIGNFICERLGAACDFIVQGKDMREVAEWVYKNTEVDRVYFYGRENPIHVSFSNKRAHQFVEMLVGKSGRRTPRVVRVD